jgi:hypothetical protein
MQTVSNAFTSGITALDKGMASAFSNQYFTATLAIFVLLYAGLAAPNLPPFIAALFNSNLFKLLCLFAILVVLNYNVTVALIMAIAFMLSLQTLQRYRVFDYAATVAQPIVALGEMTVDTARSGVGAISDVARAGVNAVSGVLSPMTGPIAGPIGTYPAMVDVNSGCGIPSSCDGLCGGQPMGSANVLPPGGVNDEVSGLCGCDSEGPQGLKFPPGYENLGAGAVYNDCN